MPSTAAMNSPLPRVYSRYKNVESIPCATGSGPSFPLVTKRQNQPGQRFLSALDPPASLGQESSQAPGEGLLCELVGPALGAGPPEPPGKLRILEEPYHGLEDLLGL